MHVQLAELEQVTDSVLSAGRDEKGPGEAKALIDPESVVDVCRRSSCRVGRARMSSSKDWS